MRAIGTLGLLAAGLAVAGAALWIAIDKRGRAREADAPPVVHASGNGEPASAPAPELVAGDTLVLGAATAGRARVDASPYRFEVSARGYRASSEGVVLEGLSVKNATAAPAFEVRFYALGSGLPPGGERTPIGDIEAGAESPAADVALPTLAPPAGAPPLRFYLAYRVAAEEPTWLLSESRAIVLREPSGG